MTRNAMHRRTRLAAITGAAAIVTSGLLGATAASAAPQFGNIDEDATGSITVHKHERATSTATGAPDGSSAPSSGTIDGVTFEAYPVVGIDLSNADDWDQLSGLTGLSTCDVPSPLTKGAAVGTSVTANGGVAEFNGLAVGVYLVCETDAPSTVVDRAKPFVVTIPLPYQDGWIYDVHAYPKNGVAGIEKEVQAPGGLGLGATIKFPVTTDIASIEPSDNFSSYIVSDTLDSRLTSGAVESVTIDGTAVDPSLYDVITNAPTVEVVFNAAGLAWLKTQGGKQIVTVFTGVVASVGNGEIENTATLYVNDPGKTGGITSNPVTTNWGDVRIHKVDSATPATGLAGAEFEVYEGDPAYGSDCSAAVAAGPALTVNGSATFVSDSSGVITIAGLFVSDTNTGNQQQRCYVLKETKAPAGFVTPTGPAAFTPVSVLKGQTATNSYDVTITNTQQEVPELPLTGAAGQTLMVGGGLGLLAVGAVLFAIRRRAAAKS